LCAAQEQSSPFETLAQRTELDPSALELLRRSALAVEPRGFERELDEFVASTLKGKRDVDGLLSFAVPLADAHPDWASLQRAAAAADWEFMDWTKAARRLEHAVDATAGDPLPHLWLVEALLRADEAPAALKRAEFLVQVHPDHLEARKLRAIAALRAGDPRGKAWLDEELRARPGDSELTPYLAAGSLPPMWPSLGIPFEAGPASDH
ncbi:MAG TPA: hypothetical protein VM509_00680, partial [Planctomycetota bacterium]|nr:hypothetical protein [Planctomycetota bacterium]